MKSVCSFNSSSEEKDSPHLQLYLIALESCSDIYIDRKQIIYRY
jgi:hypothetical protein